MIEKMIQDDPSNNSAWSYWYFLVAKQREFDIETYTNEIKYALQFVTLKKDRENEAVWVYIWGHYCSSEEEH